MLLYKDTKWRIKKFKQHYKTGDWVVIKSVKQSGDGNGILKDNFIAKLCEIDHKYSLIDGRKESCSGMCEPDWAVFYEYSQYTSTGRSYRGIKTSHIIRRATPEEIILNRNLAGTNNGQLLYF